MFTARLSSPGYLKKVSRGLNGRLSSLIRWREDWRREGINMCKWILPGIVSATLFGPLAWSAETTPVEKSENSKASEGSAATAPAQRLEKQILSTRKPTYNGPPVIDPPDIDPCPEEATCAVDICLNHDGPSVPCAPHAPATSEDTGLLQCQRANGSIFSCLNGTVHAVTSACWCTFCDGYCNFGACTSSPGRVKQVILVCQ
jgi:hypothetical protein